LIVGHDGLVFTAVSSQRVVNQPTAIIMAIFDPLAVLPVHESCHIPIPAILSDANSSRPMQIVSDQFLFGSHSWVIDGHTHSSIRRYSLACAAF
jgi:hypothetical protein